MTAVALSKMEHGELAYEYLIAGGDGHLYLRWDHELIRPSDGDVDRFREGPVPSALDDRHAAHQGGSAPGTPAK